MKPIKSAEVRFVLGGTIVIPGTLYAVSRKTTSLRLALDTGATSTHISKEILKKMGYRETNLP